MSSFFRLMEKTGPGKYTCLMTAQTPLECFTHRDKLIRDRGNYIHNPSLVVWRDDHFPNIPISSELGFGIGLYGI